MLRCQRLTAMNSIAAKPANGPKSNRASRSSATRNMSYASSNASRIATRGSSCAWWRGEGPRVTVVARTASELDSLVEEIETVVKAAVAALISWSLS